MTLFHVALVAWAAAAVYFGVLWLAPYTLVSERRRCPQWLIPGYLAILAQDLGVDVYLVGNADFGNEGYGAACWLGPRRAVLVNIAFFHHAPVKAVEFLLAHELAHHYLGHPLERFVMRAIGAALWGKVRLARFEHLQESEANRLAEKWSEMPRTVLWGVGVVVAAAGGSGQPSEEQKA